jgi:hypothetical protein
LNTNISLHPKFISGGFKPPKFVARENEIKTAVPPRINWAKTNAGGSIDDALAFSTVIREPIFENATSYSIDISPEILQ